MRVRHGAWFAVVAASCTWAAATVHAAPPTPPTSNAARPRAVPLLAAARSDGRVADATQAAAPTPGPGAKAPAANAKAERAARIQEARTKLEGGEPEAIQEAFATLRDVGGAEASTLVAARLRRGLPPHLTDAAIDTLIALGQTSASPALLELALHRRWQVREKAVAALGALKVKTAQSALLYALDDPSPEVRSSAVRALENVGDARAVPAVLVAVDRGVDGALVTLGKLAGQKELELLLQRARTAGIASVEPALARMLARKELAAASKRKILFEVSALGTPEATSCLVRWSEVLAPQVDPRTATEIRSLAAKSAGASGAAPSAEPRPAVAASTNPDTTSKGGPAASTGGAR